MRCCLTFSSLELGLFVCLFFFVSRAVVCCTWIIVCCLLSCYLIEKPRRHRQRLAYWSKRIMLAVGCHLSCCFLLLWCCLFFVVSWAIGWLKATAAQTIGHGPSGLCSRSDWFKTGKAFRSRRHMSVFLVSDRCLAGWTAVGKTDGRLPGPMDGSALLWESANHRNIIWAKPLIWVKFTLHCHSIGQVWSCGNWQLWWERSGG